MINNLFIVGVGRSGTSLLQSMMDSHSSIRFLPETQFVRTYLSNSHYESSYTKVEIEKIIRNSTIMERIPESKLTSIFSELEEVTTFRKFYDSLLKEKNQSSNLQFYGDKDPRLLDYIESIARYFPDARVLHMYRDPRDIILSKTKADWSRSRPFWLHAFIGQAQISAGRRKGKECLGDNFIELKYEDLINNPEKTLKSICEKLGVAFEVQMLEYQSSSKRLVSSNELQWKKETLKPLIKNNVEKWRNELSGYKVGIIECMSPEWFEKLDYKKSKSGWLSILFRPMTFFFNLVYQSRL